KCDPFLIAGETNQQHITVRGKTESTCERAGNDFDSNRKQPRLQNHLRARAQLFNGAGCNHSRLTRRSRPQFEIHFSNDSKAAKTTGEQFAQIVTSDVLHDSPARFYFTAISKHDFHSDHRAARSPISELLRAADACSNDAADRCTAIVRWIEW